jgi:hypothetical protein
MMGLLTHRWLSSDESSSLSAYENNGPAPTDQNYHWPDYWLDISADGLS